MIGPAAAPRESPAEALPVPQVAVRAARGHRTSAAMGILVHGLPVPLRAPSGWPRKRPWPPPLGVAVSEIRRRWNVRQMLGPTRSPFWLTCFAGALALQAWPTEANIIAGMREFLAAAEIRGPNATEATHRPVCLYNAAVLASHLPSRTMDRFAAEVITDAVRGIASEIGESVEPVIAAVEQGLIDAYPLSWKGMSLVATTRAGRLRMESLPPQPLTGTWEGVREVLRDRGFIAPESSPCEAVVLVREGQRLRVRPVGLDS